MASTGDLRSLLGPVQYNTIPPQTAALLQQAWGSHTDTLKGQLEKVKVDSEQKVAELQASNEELSSKLAVFTDESERGQTALQQYREQATSSSGTLARLTEELSVASCERDDLRRQLFTARAERDDMTGLAERRQGEVERLSGEVKELIEQVRVAQGAKCEAVLRVEEVETREGRLDVREKRMEEEKEFLQGQIKLLQEEVETRCEEVLKARREAGRKLAEMTQELAEKTEKVNSSAKREELVRVEANRFKERSEKLSEKLKEARDSENKMEDNFRAELTAQTKLASLYQSHSEENTGKTEELSGAVKELQDLLKESSEKYGVLEKKMVGMEGEHKTEVSSKEETVAALKKELEVANKLIKTLREKGLSEDSIECLSPSAAQASRLLKSGITVTGIYSQMVGLGEELAGEKEENQRLNLYIEQILHEIEERAPLLKQQREDYEKAMAAVGGLTENLEAAREEVELRRSEAEEARRRLNTMEKDRDRLEYQVTDLGKQVTTLVREVEASRGSSRRQSPRTQPSANVSNVGSVIEGRLLTFHDVTELQQKNIELLAVVRELSAGQEAAESRLVEEKTAEVRQELDGALRQVEELRSARERQQLMVENIIQQRDMYKSMASGQSAVTPSKQVKKDDKDNNSAIVKELQEVKKDFAEYKEEKGENFRMLSEQLDKMREDLGEARTRAAKLGSQEEYNTERFNIVNTNNESLKGQISALESRNNQLQVISGKHEASVAALRTEILESQTRLSRAELEGDRMKLENNHLAAVQARLAAEKEVWLKEKASNSRIEANLQQIQVNLERGEEQEKLKLQSANEQLEKEVTLLRKKLEIEQDQYRDSVRSWEQTNKGLRDKSETAMARERTALDQLASSTATLDTMQLELKDSQEQLQMAQTRLAGRGLSKQGSVVDGQAEPNKSRLRDVELLMAQTKQELKSVNNQLIESKKRAEEFKEISEAAEKRMVESSGTMAEFQTQLEQKLKLAEEERAGAEKRAGQAQAESAELVARVKELESEAGASGGELRERLQASLTQLEEVKAKLESSEKVEKEARTLAENLGEEAKEAQEKYQRELVLHAKDIEALTSLKRETTQKKMNKKEVEEEKRRLNEKLKAVTKDHSQEMDKLKSEVSTIKEQLETVNGENSALHKQLETVSQQMSDMSVMGGLNTSGSAGADTSINTSLSEVEENANNTQLMAIIKYLRRDKDILTGRLEVVQAEVARTSSQLDHQTKVATEALKTLQTERQHESQTMLSASKHGELIRKVETLSAMTDSNRMLREEKEKLQTTVEEFKTLAAKAESSLVPLESRLKEVEERASNLAVEKMALQTEADKWKKRSDQLVEKSFKINPEELKKLQDTKVQLTKTLNNVGAEKKQLEEKLSSQTKDLETIKQQLSLSQQEGKKNATDLQEKTKELQRVSQQSAGSKNIQANLQRQVNDLKKKTEELEKNKQEANNSLTVAGNKHKQEIAKLKKEAEDNRSGNEDLNKVKKELDEVQKLVVLKDTEIETQKKDIAAKESEINKNKTTVMQLKKIGRNFREKAEASEKTLTELTEEKKKVDEELAKAIETGGQEASGSTTKKDEESEKLLEDALGRLTELEEETNKLKTENEELAKKSTEKEERAKAVLKNARARITKCEEEKKQLEKELEEITLRGDTAGSSEADLRTKALMSQYNSMRTDKDRLETEKAEALQEKERLMEQVEQLQQELVASQLASQGTVSKPVAVAGVVQQAEKVAQARKQPQPQAHIQPHRHQPRDEHRHTQTASIRPMAQRATSQAVVLPTSQGAQQVQPEVATVQPTVSISPSVSSASGTPNSGQQMPSTSQPGQQALDPAAQEFFPQARSASGEMELEDPPRAVVTPRQDQPQASTSAPAPTPAPGPSAPSTSGASCTPAGSSPSAPTTASVPPTLKRPMEAAPDSDSQSSTEERAGPSGYQKKARTASSSETVQVSSGGAEAGVVEQPDLISGSQEVESDSSMQVEGGEGERREVGSSSSMDVVVGTSGEVAASSGVATSSQEEVVLDSEQEGEEDEDIEEGEVGEDIEEGGGPNLEGDNLDEDYGSEEENEQEEDLGIEDPVDVSSDEEGEIGEEQPQAMIPEDNSSEPSSSTGQQGREASGGMASQAGLAYEQDPGEDSVVPSTPKLPLTRRADGFAEAVSSPQVPSSDRFVFAGTSGSSGPDVMVSSSNNSGLAGQEGLDRTAVDIQLFASTGGSSASTAQSGGQEQGGGEEAREVSQEREDSEEGGVSSVVSSTEQGASRASRVARSPIVWDAGSSGTTSTSPQRQSAATQGLRSIRGTTAAAAGSTRGTSARGTSGTARGGATRRSRAGGLGVRRGQ